MLAYAIATFALHGLNLNLSVPIETILSTRGYGKGPLSNFYSLPITLPIPIVPENEEIFGGVEIMQLGMRQRSLFCCGDIVY